MSPARERDFTENEGKPVGESSSLKVLSQFGQKSKNASLSLSIGCWPSRSPAVCQEKKIKKAYQKKKNQTNKTLWRSGDRSLSERFCAGVFRDAGRQERRGGRWSWPAPYLLLSPRSCTHLATNAPPSGGRDLPSQWPRPSREAGGEAADPAGRIFPPRQRRRPGRYHGDRGGRRLPSAQTRAVCRQRAGALQARPIGSSDWP